MIHRGMFHCMESSPLSQRIELPRQGRCSLVRLCKESPMAVSVNDLVGTWDMVHDDWRGSLVVRPPSQRFNEVDGPCTSEDEIPTSAPTNSASDPSTRLARLASRSLSLTSRHNRSTAIYIHIAGEHWQGTRGGEGSHSAGTPRNARSTREFVLVSGEGL